MTEPGDDLTARLAHAGIKARSIDAVLRIDALMQNWRRKIVRRELGQKALAELGIGIDLAQLDVLVAIDAPRNEFGETSGEETMVNTIAERLAIDPSRASRIVAEMVDAGYAARIASQADARRTLVTLTAAGRAVVEGVRAYKFLQMGDFLDGWSREEITTFVPLLERFTAWTEGTPSREPQFAEEIEALGALIRKETRKLQRKAG